MNSHSHIHFNDNICMIKVLKLTLVILSGDLDSVVFVPMMYREVSEVSNNRLAHSGSLQPLQLITVE